jgi:uncharacterized protein
MDIDPARITPPGGDLPRWMTAFPSFGFLLTAKPDYASTVIARFHKRDIGAEIIGAVTAGSVLALLDGAQLYTVWDHARAPYLGLAPKEPAHA